MRFVALPQIEAHRDDIAGLLSRQLGLPVEIDAIATGWDGWNPEVTVRGLRVRDRGGLATLPLLELPSVSGVVSWTSLPLVRLTFKELSIERPRLSIRRDTTGRVHVAGIEFDPEASGDDRPLVDWLLRQRLIVVRDALIVWNDDLRNAPQLLLDNVHFRLESRFGHHRFALRGTPPPEISSPIDLRGDLAAESFKDWQRAKGELYVRLDYADVAAWREWLPLPMPLESGEGALRLWFEFAEGVATRIVADLELAEVRARFEKNLAPLELLHLSGRVTWRQDGAAREITASELAFVPRVGMPLPPVDFTLAYEVAPNGGTVSGEGRVDRIELEPLAAIAAHLPLPERLRNDLERYSPRGGLVEARYEWKGAVDAPETFRARAELSEVGINPQDDAPGVTGLSGVLDASTAGGTFRVGSRNLVVALPRILPTPITLDSASGEAKWERGSKTLSVRASGLEFANADATGTGEVAWRSRENGPGDIDLRVKLARADVRHLEQYLPQQLPAGLRTWLVRALQGGTFADARLVLKGDLAEFPFADGKSGRFQFSAKAQGASLDYAEGWPPLSDIDADVRFDGSRMSVVATHGRALGATLGKTTAEIPDLRAPHPRLRVEGEASGPSSEFIAFVGTSPVAGWIDHATDGLEATGNGKLDLRIDMSLGEPGTRVSGEYAIVNNQLRFPGIPQMSQVNGKLQFTDREVRATDIAFELLGGPAHGSFTTADGRVNITATGTARLVQLRNELKSPLLDHASGTTDWRLAVVARPGFASWVLESPLRGAAIDLPSPLGKAADVAVPLRIERRALAGTTARDEIRVDYGNVARVVAQRRLLESGPVADRALVLLGRALERGGEPERPGIAVRGDLASVNVDEWLWLLQDAIKRDVAAGAETLDVTSLDLQAAQFDVLGRGFHDVAFGAQRSGSDWRLTIASREMEGAATWEPSGPRHANGRVVAQLARLALPGPGEVKPWPGAPRATLPRAEGSANPWPEIEIIAERYVAKRGELGRLELVAKPEGSDWRVEKLALTNDAGTIAANGWWRSRGERAEDPVGRCSRCPGCRGVPRPIRVAGRRAWCADEDRWPARVERRVRRTSTTPH